VWLRRRLKPPALTGYYIAWNFRNRNGTVPKKPSSLVDFGRMAAQRFGEERCMQVTASLTFTTLLAIVPIVTVAVTLISAFPVFRTVTEHIEGFLFKNMLPESVEAIAAYTGQFAKNAARLTLVGIVFLFVTAMMVLFTIDRAFNQIWRVPRGRTNVQRVFIYWALIRGVAELSVADVYHLFVFRAGSKLPARQSGQMLDQFALELAGSIEAGFKRSLEELFQRAAGPDPAVAPIRIHKAI
jgi:hypothetical protein